MTGTPVFESSKGTTLMIKNFVFALTLAFSLSAVAQDKMDKMEKKGGDKMDKMEKKGKDKMDKMEKKGKDKMDKMEKKPASN
jgi:hypothetical protein